MSWHRIAHELLSLPTAPLREHAVAEWLSAFATARGYGVRRDRSGNLLIHVKGAARAKEPFAFCAHMDHPGFEAGEMASGEVLRATWRGWVPPELFEGAKVRFFSDGRWVKGVVIFAQMHAHAWGKPRGVRVRVKRPVAPGSVGMWDFPDPRLRGTRLHARGHDCVSGCAALACLLDEVRRRGIDGEFHALFTRAEESGFLGAIGAGRQRSLPKRCRIVAIETSRALPNARLGDGAVIRVGDSASIFDPDITAQLCAAAEAVGSKGRYQRRLMDGGICESTVYREYGYRAGGLCLPLGNYHNVDWNRRKLRAEVIDWRDFESLVRLLIALARGKAAATPFMRERFDAMFETYGNELTEPGQTGRDR